MNANFKQITTFNFGEEISTRIQDYASSHSQSLERYRDALYIPFVNSEAWLFDYGIMVFWGVSEGQRAHLFKQCNINATLIKNIQMEHLRFTFSEETAISRDIITLSDKNPLTRLAISHALAQSLKLVEYELKAQDTIQSHSNLPFALATHGKINLSRREIAKVRGRLYETKSDIILHYGLLDTPDFFWEYPQYETIYNTVAKYLEIHQRVNLLSKKLETIHELFEMLADEQKHQHSATLEWIVILLIAFEIVIFLAQKLGSLIF